MRAYGAVFCSLMLAFACRASGVTRYVDINCATPQTPYTNLLNAATNIQDAIDIANSGDAILVSPGVYSSGGRVVYGQMTNRVVVDKAVAMIASGGPGVTHIVGFSPTNSPYDRAVRCVYLGNGAVLSGFTVRDGATRRAGDSVREQNGGGVFCEPNAVLSNCVIRANYASANGGGARGGIVWNCVIVSNFSSGYGGGAANCTIYGTTVTNNESTYYGGGLSAAFAYDSVVANNRAPWSGGGTYNSTLTRCQIRGNVSLDDGGGSYQGSADSCWYEGNSANDNGGAASSTYMGNCVVVGNDANNGGGLYSGVSSNCTIVNNYAFSSGGGTYSATLRNSIIYENAANSPEANYNGGTFSYCCTAPLLSGTGNFTNAPLFDGGSFALASNSPCIDAGVSNGLPYDYSGQVRPLDGNNDGIAKPDVGAYEYFNGAADSDGDGLTDDQELNVYHTNPANADSDGDGMYDGWEVANALSPLAGQAPTVSPTNAMATDGAYPTRVRVTWDQLQAFRNYEVWRGPNSNWNDAGLLVTDVATNAVDDSNAVPYAVYFYWVRAKNDYGVSGFGSSDSGMLLSPPTNVNVSDAAFEDRVRVTWDQSVGATSYELWRNSSDSTSGVTVVSSSVATNTYDYTTSNPTNVHYFWVKAKNAAGTSGFSSNDSGFVRISAPGGVSATDGSVENAIRVTWNAVSGASGYQVWRSTNDDSGLAVLVAAGLGTNAHLDAMTAGAVPYFYWVSASNALSASVLSAWNSGFWVPAPTGVQASDGVFEDRVRVSWEPPAGAAAYDVWRALTNNSAAATRVATSVATNTYDYLSSNATNLQYFWVKARSGTGTSEFSAVDSGYVRILPPTGVTASDGTFEYAIRVSWSAVSGASGYQVWRGMSEDSGLASLVASGLASNEYVDGDTTGAVAYFYWASASNELSTSVLSTSNSGYWLSPPTAVAASDGTYTDRIVVSWDLPVGISSVEVWRGTSASTSTAARVADNVVGSSYDDMSVGPGQVRYYWAKSKSPAGSSGFSASNSGYRGLSAPQNVAASDGSFMDRVAVSWAAVTGASSYEVWWSTSNSISTAVQVASGVTGAAYSDATAYGWRTNYYWVRAMEPGASAYSTPDGGTKREIDASDDSFSGFIRIAWSLCEGATSYEVWRNIVNDSGSASRVADDVASNAYDDVSAFPSQLYYYWVKPKNGPILRFSQSDTGIRSLSPPATVQASNGSSTENIHVTWSAVGGATSYEVWRNTINETNSATRIATNVTVTSYADTPGLQGFVYYYWVRAVSVFSRSGFGSSDWGFRRLSTPESVSATDGVPDDRVVVTWQPVVGSVFYEVWRNTVDSTNSAVLYADFVGDTVYEDTGADVSTLHYYWVRAKNAVSTSSFSLSDSGFGGVSLELDSDGDGVPDVQENYAGTNPNNSNSFLRLVVPFEGTLPPSGGFVLSWMSESTKQYRIEISGNLAEGAFSNMVTGIPATPPVNVYTDVNAAVVSPRFYRIGVE